MDFVLGIDGGGTKTAAVILDSAGHILACGEGGPSTYGVVPLQVTRNSIFTAVSEATRKARFGQAHFAAVFMGLGNVAAETDRRAVRKIAVELGLAHEENIGVDHDIRIALAGGLSGRPGMVLIAGTGTSCFGMNAAGQTWRAGGWGPLIDDEGSSYWLGIQAMRAAVRDFDGRGPATNLTQAVMEHLALPEMDELMNRLYAGEMTRTEIATLAPFVFAAAQQGDVVAQQMIQRGCEAMAECVLAAAQRLGLTQGTSKLAVVGGLVNAGEAFLGTLRTAVLSHLPQCTVQLADFSPAIGAGLLALQRMGLEVNETILANLRQSTPND